MSAGTVLMDILTLKVNEGRKGEQRGKAASAESVFDSKRGDDEDKHQKCLDLSHSAYTRQLQDMATFVPLYMMMGYQYLWGPKQYVMTVGSVQRV
jgi:hypothetical protein